MSHILKQNQGDKVLRQSQGEKILKSNFDLGNSYHNNVVSSAIYISIPYFSNIPQNQFGSLELFFGTIQAASAGIVSSGFLLIQAINITSGVALTFGGLYSSLPATIWTNSNHIVIDGDGKLYTQGLLRVDSTGVLSGSNIGDFRIGGRIGLPAQTWYGKIAYVRYYSRKIGIDEVVFSFNKGLGNEPLITLNLEIEYLFTRAEILDFSVAQDGSSMRVGVRNSGSVVHAHGEIIGLPAGTLTEKRDYANTNLIKAFL